MGLEKIDKKKCKSFKFCILGTGNGIYYPKKNMAELKSCIIVTAVVTSGIMKPRKTT